MYFETFDAAYSEVKLMEGGYSNDPLDSGGETYKGISRKNWPNWTGWQYVDVAKQGSPQKLEDILDKNATLQGDVKQFYRMNFWDKMRCDDLPKEIRFELFDTAVNQGDIEAVKTLQRALNIMNDSQRLYADIDPDGGVGTKTIVAARSCTDKALLFKIMNVMQGARYIQICEANKKQERFVKGWMNNRVKF